MLDAAASADTFLSPHVSRQPYRGSLLQTTVKRQPVEQLFSHPPMTPGDGGREGHLECPRATDERAYALHRDRHPKY
jgi:hypothetical protein